MPEQIITVVERITEVAERVTARPEIAGVQAYEYFRSDLSTQKAGFISGEQLQLEPHYPDLSRDRIIDLATETVVVLRSLMVLKDEKAVALYDAIEYRFAEMFMISLAADMQDTGLSQGERQEASDWFVQTNEALYGKPQPEIFGALVQEHVQKYLNTDYDDRQPVAQDIQRTLKELIGDVPMTDYETFKPESDVVDQIQGLISERFSFVLEHIEDDRTYTVADMPEALDRALNLIGGKELGWQVKTVPNSTVLAVSAHQRLVEVGDGRKSSTGKEFKAKVLHEVGVHALRSINAEKAGWLSAAYGQEGYLDFEESFATALEDAYAGKFADHGVDYYLVAGFAYGLDGHVKRDFRDVYEIMWRQKALKSVEGEAEIQNNQITKAKANAFNACVRLFRGTTAQEPGVVYLKDLAYFKGQEQAWSVLANVETQEDLDLLFAGKLDLTNPDHLRIARRILENSKKGSREL